ncbi:MAG: hypothetical protein JSR82_12615 [Verrucomicrobia bacterium]|nr:hypothetical protein [Verrucomicrobiota bacterium]
MPRRLQMIATALAVVAICSATGAHWALLQSMAWLRMLAVYAQDRPIAQAVAETFDGEHPCELCVAIKEAKKQEEQQRGAPVELPITLGCKLLLALVAKDSLPVPPVTTAEGLR